MRRLGGPAARGAVLALGVGLLVSQARAPTPDTTAPAPPAVESEATSPAPALAPVMVPSPVAVASPTLSSPVAPPGSTVLSPAAGSPSPVAPSPAAGSPPSVAPSPLAAASPAPDRAVFDYLSVVRGFANTMITHGRDTYGDVRSPLFTTTLERGTLGLPTGVPSLPGVRDQDRAINAANPMHDENLYQVLYALTEITGDPGYARAADEALGWFFRHAQSPTTGLLAWGEHLGWDLRAERRTDGSGSAARDDDDDEEEDWEGLFRYGTHEYYRPWVLWDRSFALAPEPAARFARAVWQGHVGNRKTGSYDRHAGYDRRDAGRGQEFPRHGGFYIDTWAAAYQRTGDREFLRAITALVGYFERHRDASTGILVATSGRRDLAWPFQNLSLAIDLWDAARRIERPNLPATYRELPKRMRESAVQIDRTVLQLARTVPYSLNGFARRVNAKTLQPEGEPAFTAPWTSSYGHEIDAQAAMLYLLRFRQTGEAEYRALALAAADRYLGSEPASSEVLYPGTLGQAIALQVAAYRLTGRPEYLARADHFGRLAVERFFGSSTLPAASSRSTHYEALTRGDTLAMALLDVWLAANRPGVELPLIFTDR